MKSTNKMFLLGMIGILLVFGFVLGSCKEVYAGDAYGYDIDASIASGTKSAKLTLTSKTYKIEWGGKTYEGNCTKNSASYAGIKFSEYKFTSGGTGWAEVFKISSVSSADFSYKSDDGVLPKVYIYSSGDMSKSKSIADDGAILVDELELIIIDDEDDE